MRDPNLEDVRAAAERIRGLTCRTPLKPALELSRLLDRRILLKMETQQATGAFKLRGAANCILRLGEDERRRGVITQSSGNHGRAVAYVCRELGIEAVICVSTKVPAAKVEAMRCLGAQVVVEGEDQDASWAVAEELVEERGLTFVPAFDHPDVIAGQGTLGLELIEQCPDLDTLVIQVSGGGLAAGAAMAAKSLRPDLRAVGVSQADGAAIYESLRAGRLVEVVETPSLADALIGGLPADNRWTLPMCRRWVDEIRLVPEAGIARGMRAAFEKERLILEGGGAIGIGLLLQEADGRALDESWGERIAVVCSGDNVDLGRWLEVVTSAPGEEVEA